MTRFPKGERAPTGRSEERATASSEGEPPGVEDAPQHAINMWTLTTPPHDIINRLRAIKIEDMAFKRKRVYAPRRALPSKRRRFVRKRFSRAKRSMAYTSQSGVGQNVRYRSRRLRPRAWRSILWRDTLAQSHFRSCFATNTLYTVAGTANQYQVINFTALRLGGNAFYTPAGGLVQPDGGVNPTFQGNIIMRGGIIGLRLNNYDTGAQSVHVKAMLIKTSMDLTVSTLPANVHIGWDPSLITDFQRFIGKVVMQREALLTNEECVDFKFRLRPWKIDKGLFESDANSFIWVLLISNVEGATTGVNACPYFNVSFAGDVTAP